MRSSLAHVRGGGFASAMGIEASAEHVPDPAGAPAAAHESIASQGSGIERGVRRAGGMGFAASWMRDSRACSWGCSCRCATGRGDPARSRAASARQPKRTAPWQPSQARLKIAVTLHGSGVEPPPSAGMVASPGAESGRAASYPALPPPSVVEGASGASEFEGELQASGRRGGRTPRERGWMWQAHGSRRRQ